MRVNINCKHFDNQCASCKHPKLQTRILFGLIDWAPTCKLMRQGGYSPGGCAEQEQYPRPDHVPVSNIPKGGTSVVTPTCKHCGKNPNK